VVRERNGKRIEKESKKESRKESKKSGGRLFTSNWSPLRSVTAQAQERLHALSTEDLKRLRKALLHAASLKELGLATDPSLIRECVR